MSEFKVINTQEEFDSAIAARLQRERESIHKQYADHDELKKQNEEYRNQLTDTTQKLQDALKSQSETENKIAELNSKIKAHETDSAKTRIALETGLPYQFASKLSGETDEEIRADAEKMIEIIGSQNTTPPPLRTNEGDIDEKKAALASLLKN